MKRTSQANAGFTLIEVLIVVAIIGILSAIAMPMYGDYVTRSKIQQATAGLGDARVKMEQFFLDNRTYAGGAAPGPAVGRQDFLCQRHGTLTLVVRRRQVPIPSRRLGRREKEWAALCTR
ncbi:MAG: prepilin-type N-terminal cleavage/methylation domain-containing protein [Betaproteobacteria bacterium]|nr:prepilin-type N-terminal cleavage/methylation domain-containing protein [Betaproteobacteria bacterium]